MEIAVWYSQHETHSHSLADPSFSVFSLSLPPFPPSSVITELTQNKTTGSTKNQEKMQKWHVKPGLSQWRDRRDDEHDKQARLTAVRSVRWGTACEWQMGSQLGSECITCSSKLTTDPGLLHFLLVPWMLIALPVVPRTFFQPSSVRTFCRFISSTKIFFFQLCHNF